MNAYHERITELFDEYYAAPKKNNSFHFDRIKELLRLNKIMINR